MKKVLSISLLVAMTVVPSLAFAIQPCGIICSSQARPLYAQCDKDLQSCIDLNGDTGRPVCVDKNQTCVANVRSFQLDCVDRCMNGEEVYGF
ncbi:MAG: hypothetical protein HQK50_03145 [Oligoflexia bacterium]|nr:hypothetical protein [Oligoflexia bacterium]MBF0364538.1 hypothetical protein [Oligoflexia bacterium]